MQVSAINVYSTKNEPAFTAKIIDSHSHFGKFMGKEYEIDNLDKFIKSEIPTHINGKKGSDTIEKMIVSNCDAIEGTLDELAGNKKILNIIRGREEYLPLAVCQPAKTNGDTSKIKQLFQENPGKFVGLKFHGTCLPLENEAKLTESYLPYMKFAQEKKIPCLFHCQGGQASGETIYKLAQQVPDVPVILGHAGSMTGEGRANREAALNAFKCSLKNKDANIYLDLSWVGWQDNGFPAKKHNDVKEILEIAKEHKATNKILFGTDAPLGCFGEWESPHFSNKTCYSDTVSAFKEQINEVFGKKGKSIANEIFYENANKLYVKNNKFGWLNNKQTKYAVAAIGAIGVAFTGIKTIKHFTMNEKDKFQQKIKSHK